MLVAAAMGDEVDYDDLLADAEQEGEMYDDFMDDIEAEMAMEAEVNKPHVFEPHGLRREQYIMHRALLDSTRKYHTVVVPRSVARRYERLLLTLGQQRQQPTVHCTTTCTVLRRPYLQSCLYLHETLCRQRHRP